MNRVKSVPTGTRKPNKALRLRRIGSWFASSRVSLAHRSDATRRLQITVDVLVAFLGGVIVECRAIQDSAALHPLPIPTRGPARGRGSEEEGKEREKPKIRAPSVNKERPSAKGRVHASRRAPYVVQPQCVQCLRSGEDGSRVAGLNADSDTNYTKQRTRGRASAYLSPVR